MGHKFEIFSAGCNLCQKAVETIRKSLCDDCEIVEYDLHAPIKEEIQEKINKYDIKVVPTIIVDEKHKYIGMLTQDELTKIIADV
ncbi:MAG: thioredoxin family protein [Promethearchaeota archaeon]|jgi:protein-disulfide isomerase